MRWINLCAIKSPIDIVIIHMLKWMRITVANVNVSKQHFFAGFNTALQSFSGTGRVRLGLITRANNFHGNSYELLTDLIQSIFSFFSICDKLTVPLTHFIFLFFILCPVVFYTFISYCTTDIC